MKNKMIYLLSILLALNVFSCKENAPEPVEPEKKDTVQPTPTPKPEPRAYTQCRGYITPKYHNWIWEEETPSLEVIVVNPNPYDTVVPLMMTIKSCVVTKTILIDTITQFVRIKAGDSTAVYISPSKKLEPEYYCVSMKLDGKIIYTKKKNWQGEKKTNTFNIGVDPTKINSPYDGQPDFDQFWADTKKELRSLYADNPVKIISKKEANNSTIYFIEAQSITLNGDSGKVRFYYSEPKAAGTYPCQIQFPGYDQPQDPFSCPLYGNANQCEMFVCPRGQYANARAPYKNEYGEWIKYGIKSKETFYYRGAYMDAVRAVDYAFAQEKVDTTQVFAFGSSQGGALTLAAAALSDHQFAAISPCVPFLGDWPDFFELSYGYPVYIKTAAKKAGITDEEALKVISYIDTKNIAHMITCPVLEIICLQDEVCPPHTNTAIWTNLTNSVDRDVLHYSPLEDHAWAEGWDQLRSDFFKKYKK